MSDKHQLETNMKHANLPTLLCGMFVVIFDLKTYALDSFTTNLMEHVIQCAAGHGTKTFPVVALADLLWYFGLLPNCCPFSLFKDSV